MARARLALIFPLLILLCANVAVATLEWKHHNNDELLEVLESVHNKCKNVTRVYQLSEPSVRGTPLHVIEFSTHPGHHELSEFKYITLSC